MDKQEEFRGLGNERLKPIAIEGDKDAVAELKRRGNTLEDGRLVKTRRSEYTDARGIEHVETVKVADGRIIERNGEKV